MAASAAGLVTSLVADVCDSDISTCLARNIGARVDAVPALLKRFLGSSPGPEAAAALDRWG